MSARAGRWCWPASRACSRPARVLSARRPRAEASFRQRNGRLRRTGMMLRHAWPQAMANGETAMASAEILAAPGQVFTALVTDEVERWWGSADTYRMTGWKADLRVGGAW